MAIQSNITDLSAEALVSHLKQGDLSTEEIMKAYLEVIEAHANETKNPINATLYTNIEAALAQAKEHAPADRKKSLLAGLPITVKRNINVDSFPVDCSSKILQGYHAPYTATAIKNLWQNGGVVFASANMDEFAMGSANSNSAHGIVRNPLAREYIPGGSSGGPAAAVTAYETPAALGTDTGGSIRQPAACCGVVGLKPSYGRVSRYGIVAFASSFDQVGPITRTVADNALLLQSIAGHDPADSTSVDREVPDYLSMLQAGEASFKGKVIGLPKEYYEDSVHEEIAVELERVKTFYEGLGATLKPISLPTTQSGLPIYYVLATAEASTNLARFDGVRYGQRGANITNLDELFLNTRSEGFGAEVRRRMFIGGYVLSAGYYDAYYMRALKIRRRIYTEYHEALKACDLLLMPTLPYRIFKIGERFEDPVQMYLSDVFTIAANLTGLPAISVPCGTDSRGLPISFQLMGRSFAEGELYQAAHLYEQAHPKLAFREKFKSLAV